VAQDTELDAVFSALQSALSEHTERLRKLAAAKVTTWQPRGAGITLSESRTRVECAICSNPIPLEDSKVSEDGEPMHEECYVAKLTLSKPLPQPQ
jgi:hypothetical protein